MDEFAAMGLDDCLDHIWDRAEVFLDSKSEDKKYAPEPPHLQKSSLIIPPCAASSSAYTAVKNDTFTFRKLSRPYGRVDRAKLKRKLLNKCIAQGEGPIPFKSKLASCPVTPVLGLGVNCTSARKRTSLLLYE